MTVVGSIPMETLQQITEMFAVTRGEARGWRGTDVTTITSANTSTLQLLNQRGSLGSPAPPGPPSSWTPVNVKDL